ncbi:MAG TPA: hypothetical protein VHZ55_27290 [Bryobacteraceae bacterium]|nr:hypothetical protein [Bryobacteraceae bacterium]
MKICSAVWPAVIVKEKTTKRSMGVSRMALCTYGCLRIDLVSSLAKVFAQGSPHSVWISSELVDPPCFSRSFAAADRHGSTVRPVIIVLISGAVMVNGSKDFISREVSSAVHFAGSAVLICDIEGAFCQALTNRLHLSFQFARYRFTLVLPTRREREKCCLLFANNRSGRKLLCRNTSVAVMEEANVFHMQANVFRMLSLARFYWGFREDEKSTGGEGGIRTPGRL